MKLFTSDKIRAADAYTIAHEPVASINLMERAAEQLANWIARKFQKETRFKIFVGPGNNGGDGWALARLLIKKGYQDISVYVLKTKNTISADSEINRKRLTKGSQVRIKTLEKKSDFPDIMPDDIIVDALFGSGLSRPLSGLLLTLVQHINNSKNLGVIAVDIPSGLFCEDNTKNNADAIIRATFTLSFQFSKLAFFFPENDLFVGEWHILPIGLHRGFITNEPTKFQYILEDDVFGLLRKREKFSHKGTYGHALLIAGSYGMMGAAVLSARAALRAGVGLLTAHVPGFGSQIIQSSVPESLLSIDASDIIFTEHPALDRYTAVGIGPGINRKTNSRKALLKLLSRCDLPVVIDADALNILSEIENWQDILPKGTILTPHPKEFERLFGVFPNSFLRMEAQSKFSQEKDCIVILKGAYSCVTSPDGTVWINSTGNPGMASGGSGDVLTGLILGLLAQHYTPFHASILGVYIHGRAGDLGAQQKGLHGLIASDIIDNIGAVFSVLEKRK